MASVDILDIEGNKAGSAELPEDVFGVTVNVPLIHQVVVAQRNAARQGTHKVKTRGEVSGGGRKPWRQKGTGRARHGSIRSPQWAGGGIVHGPQPRNYEQRTPKKMKAAALRGALTDRAQAGRIHVMNALIDADTPSTKAALAALAKVSDRKHFLVVVDRSDDLTIRSLRNVPTVTILDPGQLNTYDVLLNDDIIFVGDALDKFLAGNKGRSVKAVATSTEAEQEETA